ncbi:MAG: hypothetical protein JNM89_06750 [Hyphomicrobiaceae bacterium]|nr:hypothetical protein [Hyphomicrobiaceae bacterium]
MIAALDLKVGDWVVVRSAGEILATLDESACLDELPFMPQMLQYCGKKLRVAKLAHKMCDTVHGTGARQMNDAVFLGDLRCDGHAFGGCEMTCTIVWKNAWLRRASANEVVAPTAPDERLDKLVNAATRRASPNGSANEQYFSCQATKLPVATKPLPWWRTNQYVFDYQSGNVGLSTLLSRMAFMGYSVLVSSGLGFGSALRWTYDAFQAMRGGEPFPVHAGRHPTGGVKPAVELGLQPGDLVRVKSIEQILETVDKRLMNRGMSFHSEMVPYCGKTFRVKGHVRKIINEKTGQLVTLKNSCIVLEGAGCHGRFTNPINCPRALPPYWREIWLERVDPATTTDREHQGGRLPKCEIAASPQ